MATSSQSVVSKVTRIGSSHLGGAIIRPKGSLSMHTTRDHQLNGGVLPHVTPANPEKHKNAWKKLTIFLAVPCKVIPYTVNSSM